MPNNQFPPFNIGVTFDKYDVIIDNNIYYYSTIDNNLGNTPTGTPYSRTVSSWNRYDDLVTLYFNQGSTPELNRGSLVVISGIVQNTSLHFTGMVVHAGSGFIQYINNGWDDVGSALTGGQVFSFVNPAWTTGFYFNPSYDTALENKSDVIIAKFGEGYSQRQRTNLNNNTNMWKLSFRGRSDKETRAIQNFIEDKGGVESFKLFLPVGKLYNNPNLKFIGTSFVYSTQFFNSNDVSVDVEQVFDIN